jgi:hypothetical protein
VSRRRRQPPHGITRDRARQVLEDRLRSRTLPAAVSALVVALAAPLLMLLVDLTGQGTRACTAGRDYLGRELHAAASRTDRRWRGKLREAYCRRQVGRVLAVLTALDLIRTVHRWNDTALRYLSDSLLADLGLIARQRQPREARPPSPAELERRQQQSHEAAERAAGVAGPVLTAVNTSPSEPTGDVSRVQALREALKRSTGPPGAPEGPAAT